MLLAVAVLGSIAIGSFNSLKKRARRQACFANLRSLYHASASYLAEKNAWPQVSSRLIHNDPGEYTRQWRNALSPYGITLKHLTCPSAAIIRRDISKQNQSGEKTDYVDYVATPFAKDPQAPYRYLTQPWFAETTGSHGKANLLILGNGEVKELSEIVNSLTKPPSR